MSQFSAASKILFILKKLSPSVLVFLAIYIPLFLIFPDDKAIRSFRLPVMLFFISFFGWCVFLAYKSALDSVYDYARYKARKDHELERTLESIKDKLDNHV